jgi:hypothetical protein
VDADAEFDAKLLALVTQRIGAPDGLGRGVERDEVAITGAFLPRCRRTGPRLRQ